MITNRYHGCDVESTEGHHRVVADGVEIGVEETLAAAIQVAKAHKLANEQPQANDPLLEEVEGE